MCHRFGREGKAARYNGAMRGVGRHSLLAVALCVGAALLIGTSAPTLTSEAGGQGSGRAGESYAGAVALPSQESLERIVRDYVESGEFIGSVLVAHGDEILLDRSYGYAEIESRQPNMPGTQFRIGSVTKQFTAAAILLLEQDGLLSLDDRIADHLPDTPPAWSGVTIFHLLTHTSGIPSFTGLREFHNGTLAPGSAEATVNLVRDRPVEFLPGQRKNYSNSGYVLAGYLLERIAGVSYEEFLRTRIFAPLGMRDSGVEIGHGEAFGHARGYVRRDGGLYPARPIDIGVLHGAGALYSTTHDLLRWTRAMFGGEFLSAESLAKLTTPFKDDYALGIAVHRRSGQLVIEHFGGVAGFNSHLAYYPESDVTVVVLANVNGATPADIACYLGAAFRRG
jgi:CubicO group peptidase (beta-lactamase class C family)